MSDDRGRVRVDVPEGTYIFRLWAVAKGHVPLFAHWEEEDNRRQSLPRGVHVPAPARDDDRRSRAGQRGPADQGRDGRGEALTAEAGPKDEHCRRHVAGRIGSDASGTRSRTSRADGRSTTSRRVTISSSASS